MKTPPKKTAARSASLSVQPSDETGHGIDIRPIGVRRPFGVRRFEHLGQTYSGIGGGNIGKGQGVIIGRADGNAVLKPMELVVGGGPRGADEEGGGGAGSVRPAGGLGADGLAPGGRADAYGGSRSRRARAPAASFVKVDSFRPPMTEPFRPPRTVK